MPAAESLEARIVPVVTFGFAAGTLTLDSPAGTALLVVEGGTSTKIYEGGTLIGTLTSATNKNVTTIEVTNGAAASLTVVGNGATLTLIDLNTTPVVSLNNAVDIRIDSDVGVKFGSTTITGDLEVDADGEITQVNGTTLTVVGTADLDANTGSADAITLINDNSAGVPVNSFGTLKLDGGAISIREGNPTNLSFVDATGAFTLYSAGGVTGADEINVAGTTTINSGKGGDISLTSTANTFASLVLSGANVTVVEDDGTDLTLGATTATGKLSVTSEGGGNDIISSGNLSVAGLATFSTSGATVVLTAATTNCGSISVVAASATVTIDEDSATNLAVVTATNLSVTSAGAITDIGTIVVSGGGDSSTDLITSSTIVLDSPANDFNGISLNGAGLGSTLSVTLVDVDGIDFDESDITGTLTVTAGGAVTDNHELNVSGKATFKAVGFGVTLNGDASTPFSNFGSISLNAATATIVEGSDTDIANTTITGATLTFVSEGNITNGTIGGYASITADAAAVSFETLGANDDITINTAVQVIATFGTLTVTTTGATGNASISEGFGTVLAGVTTGGDFTLKAIDGKSGSRSVTQTGPISVGGVTTINAGSGFEVTLQDAGNDFGTSLGLFGRNVAVFENAATQLDFSTITGTLDLESTGAITQTSTGTFQRLKVAGTTTLEGTSILLDRRDPVSSAVGASIENASNSFGTLLLTTAGAVQIIEKGPTNLGATGGASIGGVLEIVSTGTITDSGIVLVSGNTTMAAVAYATSSSAPTLNTLLTATTPTNTITLDTDDGAFVPVPTNDFQSEINLRGTNVVLKNDGDTELGAILATGTFTVTSTDDVTNPNGLVSVGGLAKFIKSDSTANVDLTLGTASDASLGSLSVVGQTSSISFRNVAIDESDSTSLGTMTVAGTLTITSAGAVTDTGIISVTGATTITTSTDDIILDSTSNNFVGDFIFLAAEDVSIVDSSGGIEFGTSDSATLTVKATGGAVTDNAGSTLNIGSGAVNITAIGNAINLNSAANTYGVVTLKGASADIADAAALTLGNVSLSGALILDANGGAVTQQTGTSVIAGSTTITASTSVTLTNVNPTNTGNRLGALAIDAPTSISVIENDAIVLGTINTAGALSLTATGTITRTSGDITAAATTLTAAGKDITLTESTNSFGSLNVTGQNVSITEDDAGTAGTAIGGTVKGNLTLTHSGVVTNNGSLLVSGSATINANVAAVASVSLNNASNQFGSISVFGSISANNPTAVTIVESGNTVLGVVTPTGALSVTSTGNITDTGTDSTSSVTVGGGTATLVSSGSITLDDDDNDFSTVDFSGVNVTLVDSILDIEFDSSEATGNLTVTVSAGSGNGDFSQVASSVLNIDGNTTIKLTGSGANDIDLGEAGNLFGGTVSLETDSGFVSLKDSDGVLDIGTTSTSGTLTIESINGGVTQSGAITAGNTVVTASSGGSSITLTHISNIFGTLELTADTNVSIVENSEIDVAANGILADNGTLLLQSTAASTTAIEQAGDIDAAGDTTLIASGSNTTITLSRAGNVFGNLFITGGTATIAETDAASGTDLDDCNLTGSLIVTSNGEDIDDSGTLYVTGTLNLTTGSAAGDDITLDDPDSTFGPLDLSADNITVTDSGAVDLFDIDADVNFTLIYGGAVTDSGPTTVGGITDISPQSLPGNQQITLNDAAVALTGSVIMTGSSILLTNTVATSLGDIDAEGTLTLTSTLGITGTGAVAVTGLATLTADATHDIDLSSGSGTSNFTTVKFIARDVTLDEIDNLDLGDSTIYGDLTVTTTGGLSEDGSISDSGILLITGTLNLDVRTSGGSTSSIILDDASSELGIDITNAVDLILLANSTIYVADHAVDDVILGAITTDGSLTIISRLSAGDDIVQLAGAVISTPVGFSALFNAGDGDVIISNGSNTILGSYSGIGANVNIQP